MLADMRQAQRQLLGPEEESAWDVSEFNLDSFVYAEYCAIAFSDELVFLSDATGERVVYVKKGVYYDQPSA